MERKFVASALVVIVLATTGMLSLYLASLGPGSADVPPPDSPPGSEVIIVTEGDLVMWAEAEFSQDFMPVVQPEGPPFHVLIRINVTNIGDSTVIHPWASRTTLYFNGTSNPLVTLNLTSTILTFAPIEIRPGESHILEYINVESEVYSPDIDEGTGLYARVLFHWGVDNQTILTTAPAPLGFTW
ncbi:MAG: hypothetical protein JSW61_08565 [Candidatus Thorarchaeota archaeon]|nr:MAG: hypothetical protein JSW61_08565 [Candidatus Thorarchaeota archaeon]